MADMHPHQALPLRNTKLLLVLIAFAIAAFGYNFFGSDLSSFVLLHHLHGVAMFAWLIMLAAQASLVLAGNRSLHRQLGKFSYALVPFIALSTISLAHHALVKNGLTPEGNMISALQLFLLLQFLVIYAYAIKHRATPDIHARWMIGTAMPMIDPIFNRFIGFYLAPVFPVLGESALLITFLATDLILVYLILRDRRLHKRTDVFPKILMICLLTQVPILSVVFSQRGMELWGNFTGWFINLSLS